MKRVKMSKTCRGEITDKHAPGIFRFKMLSTDELRRKIACYRGVRPTCKPPPGARSTTIRMYDIALLAKLPQRELSYFVSGKLKAVHHAEFGKLRLGRLSRVMHLVDGGYVQKIKHGHYIIHDEPFTPPVREMRVNIDLAGGKMGLVRGMPEIKPATMPNFSQIFRGK